MPKPQEFPTGPDSSAIEPCDGGAEDVSERSSSIGRLLSRWADAVANGEAPIPQEITSEDRQRLVAEVSRRRRARLVKYIARAIAEDILRSRGQQHGGKPTC